MSRYALYRWLDGPQGRSGRVRKIVTLTGIRFPDCPAGGESPYRLWYPYPRWFLDFYSICGLLPYRVQVMHELKEFHIGGVFCGAYWRAECLKVTSRRWWTGRPAYRVRTVSNADVHRYNALITNEMHSSYNQSLFHSFLSALHVSNVSSRSKHVEQTKKLWNKNWL